MPVLSPTAVDQVSSALSVASLRHQAIASNVANRDVEGYQRLAVRFAEALSLDSGHGATPAASIVADTAASATAAPSIEEDMVALSSNAMNYQALARILSKYFSIEQAIASGGRG
jgi:flagellar basal-body rod protein FlgB